MEERETYGMETTYEQTKKKMKRLLFENYKVVSKKLESLSNMNLKRYSVFGSWFHNDTLEELESLFLVHGWVKDEMKNRGFTTLVYEEPLKEFDELLKLKRR